MQLNALPSLPPGIQGQVYGLLTLQVGSISWLADPATVLFRVKFWGENGSGLLMSAGDVQGVPQRIKYTLRCTQPLFAKYLSDMKSLQIEVLDNVRKRLIGNIKVQLNLYLRRDNQSAKGKLAAHSKLVNLEVDGTFPIVSPDKGVKSGEVELKAWTDFHMWKADVRDSTTSVTSFQLNELKAEFDDLPKKPVERIAHSLERQSEEDFNPRAFRGEPVISVPKSNLRKMEIERERTEILEVSPPPEPKAAPKKEPVSQKEPVSHKDPGPLKEPVSHKERIEKILGKVQTLKQRVDGAVAGEADRLRVEEPVPTLADIQSIVMPEDCIVPVNIEAELDEKPIGEIHNMQKILIQITTLTLLTQVPPPVVEVSLPLPYKDEGAKQIKVLTDSFKLHHKGSADNIYKFNHSSTHDIAFGEGFYAKLANLPIRFRLLSTAPKAKSAELSRAEVPWEKLFVSSAYTYSTVLEFKGEETRRGIKADLARLSVTLSLVKEAPGSPVKQESQEPAASAVPTPPVFSKTFLMYLHLDHAFQLVPREDGSRRNLFLTYKTFPEKEQMNTPVLWNYTNETPIRHTSVVPVGEASIEKLQTALLVVEVWDKHSPNDDELLGLVKLPLSLFGTALRAGAEVFANSVYPIIAVDEYRPIQNLRQSECFGYLRVCLAMGSSAQVRRLQDSHEPLDKVEPKVESKQAAVQMTPPRSPTEVEVQTSVDRFSDKVQQHEEVKSPAKPSPGKVFESLESISDLAAFLNRREFREEVVQTDYDLPHIPSITEDSPIKVQPGQQIYEPLDVPREEPPVERLEELSEALDSVKAFASQKLEEFDACFKALEAGGSCNFQQLLEAGVNLGLPEQRWQRVLDVFLEESLESSSYSIKIQEVRDFLHIPVLSLRSIQHTFSIQVPELLNCPMLQRSGNCFLKLVLPVDEASVESEYLPPRTRNLPLNLKAELSCIGVVSRPLEDLLNCEGISLQLLQRTGENSIVLGQAVLPVEELTELKTGSSISRVLCIYAARNTQGQEILGKVRLVIGYTQKEVWKPEVDESAELIYSKQTCIERSIPREAYITIAVEGCTDLLKASRHFQTQGIKLSGGTCLARVNLFSEIDNTEAVVESAPKPFADSIAFHSMSYLELTFNEDILRYFEAKAALVEVIWEDDLALGAAKIPLVGLLLNGSISGEFPLLGEFGQYRGCLNLSLTLSKEEPFIPKKLPDPLPEPVEERKLSPVKLPEAPVPDPLLRVPEEEEEGSNLQVVIETALNLARPASGEAPNTYVCVLWKDQKLSTAPILRSSYPAWHASFDIKVDPSKLTNSEVLLQVWHKSYSSQDQELGRCSVSLAPLARVPEIDGWYHVQTPAGECGQVKVKIVPHTPVAVRKPLIELPIQEAPQNKVSRTYTEFESKIMTISTEVAKDDDLHSRLRSNLQALDDFAKTWTRREVAPPSPTKSECPPNISRTIKTYSPLRVPPSPPRSVRAASPLGSSPPHSHVSFSPARSTVSEPKDRFSYQPIEPKTQAFDMKH